MTESSIVYEFRKSLFNFLGTIKLYYNFDLAFHSNLDIIVSKIEELILMTYNAIEDNSNTTSDKNKEQCEIKLCELFYLFLSIDTNSTFYELFLKFFQKFIKKLNNRKYKSFIDKYSAYIVQIYTVLIKKKIDYIGMQSDSNATIDIIKSISMIIELFDEFDIVSEEINPFNMISFFFETNTNLFMLTKGNYHTEKFSKIINETFKRIFISDKEKYKKEFPKIIDLLLDKIIQISKIKDELKGNTDDIEQSFHVDTLIICLKLCCKFFKTTNNCIDLSYKTKIKLTKCLIDLSFWDNPKIVNYTCKLFNLFWNLSINLKNFYMRNEIEKIFDYIYLRHFNTYYQYIKETLSKDIVDNEEKRKIKIKLAVIEILAIHLNSLIHTTDFLAIIYISNDLFKIRFNMLKETFNSIEKYFSLKDNSSLYIKKTLLITFQIAFNKILSVILSHNSFSNKIPTYKSLSEKWQPVVDSIDKGKFKDMYKYIAKEFNFMALGKKDKFTSLSEADQQIHKRLAKSIAILIRYTSYVDIKNLFETMGDNHMMSKLILDEYTKTFNFRGMDLIQAYELYVSTFTLTGEQFHIYNFICSFATKWYNDNKHLTKEDGFYFKSDEQVISFAYSTMVLNTDLHNPNVTNHMSLDEYLKNNISSKLFDEVPVDYMTNIYNRIQATPLKAALPRIGNYMKEDEVYIDFECRHEYVSHDETFRNKDLIEIMDNNDNITMENYPLINLYENLYCNYDTQKEIINESYLYIYEELFEFVLSFPQSFFEIKNENIINLLNTICEIAVKLNKKDLLNRLVQNLSVIITNTKSVVPYNLFFNLTIQYTKDFHSYIEIYYQAILDVMMHKLKEENNPLRNEYIKLVDEIIYKTFHAISAKRKKQSETVGLINYFFFSGGQAETEFTYDYYKGLIYTKLGINTVIPKKNDEELIEVKQILDILQGDEEEFIFFVTLSASKILDYQNKNEFYFSLLFLKEILKNISQNNFIKIWPTLYNIFKSKMEFKKDNEEDFLFDILYTNFFLHQIVAQYFISIENEDYCQLLENYVEIDNVEILYVILENNNNLIKNAIDNKKYINDKIFDILISLMHNLIDKLSFSLKTLSISNSTPMAKFIKGIEFLTNVLSSIKDISIVQQEGQDYIYKIISILYDLQIVQLLTMINFSFNQILTFVQTLTGKMCNVMPAMNDDKWNLYLYVAQFCFKCALTENENAQIKFTENIIVMLEKAKIPLVRYNQIITILTNWHQPFLNLQIKYENFWEDVFTIFYLLFINNEEITNSICEMENLWNLFVRKYLISYVDDVKKNNKTISKGASDEIKKIYDHVNNIVKNNLSNGNTTDTKISWWTSTKNTIKLYFPDIIKEDK